MNEPWISVEQIAEHFGVTRDSIYRWIDAKGLPAHKTGRLWKFKITEVDDWARRDGAARAINQSNINATKMRQIRIPLPPLAEQKRFVSEIVAMERTIATAQATLAAAPARKQAVMQRYL